jgi:hypothetical protein
MTKLGSVVSWIAAVSSGLLIAWVDSRPGWDDAGVSAGMILVASGLFGALLPNRAWAVALAVGAWIPIVGIARDGSYGALLALLPALAGAYGGAFARRAFA